MYYASQEIDELSYYWMCDCPDPYTWRQLGNMWAGYYEKDGKTYEVIHCKVCQAKSPGLELLSPTGYNIGE